MPVETGQYLSDLNANYPNPTDGASQGDDHLRLIKSVLKTTFPAVAGVVSGSHTELNEAVASATTGTAKLADSGAFFNTNSTDGFSNPAPGEVDLVAGGNAVAKVKSDKSAAFQGAVSATGPITGPGAIPIGGTLIWWSDTLPDASFGTYAWCNGAEYPRNNTALFNVLGSKYGVGDGSTTANLPDLRDNVPVGKGTMGAVASANRITNFVTTTLGTLFGECLHLLGITELPAHTHDAGTFQAAAHQHTYTGPSAIIASGGADVGGTFNQPGTQWTGSSGPHTVSGTSASTGGGASHNNVQPSIVCNWIIRTA